jgi:DHA1 family tetracycline resistance protein-like MFS transporter
LLEFDHQSKQKRKIDLATLRLNDHPLISTLRGLRGNVRGVVLTEPLWGIPYNLYAPYVSVYMVALGLSDSQIGFIASLGLVLQFLWTPFSGAITDKFGRKRTTLITDIIAWSIPCLIWMVAQDFRYFLVAAAINSLWRITHNSWGCLLVEGTNPNLLVEVYSLIYISGLMAAFFSPLTAVLIDQFSLVPTMRFLYFLAFVMMTSKFLIMNAMVTETKQGEVRMKETHHQSILAIVGESTSVLKQVLHTPRTMVTGGLMIIVSISTVVTTTFWPILVTENLQVPTQYLSLYYVARSITMLLFYFLVMPRLRTMSAYKPMIFGFSGLILSWMLLINMPPQSYFLLLVAVILEGCSIPATNTLLDKLIAITVEPKERARIMAILYMFVLLCTSPFGWIAGQLSEINRNLPFMLNITLYMLGAVLAFAAARRRPIVVPSTAESDMPQDNRGNSVQDDDILDVKVQEDEVS